MKTTYPKEGAVPRSWHLVDASGLVLGRMAVRIATILMGKHRAIYSAHVDTGEFVVVINAGKVKITGNKLDKNMVRHHTGYLGGLKERPWGKVLAQRPEELITLAVRRMLPKTKLGRAMLKKMKVYAGADHPHTAQNPKPLSLAS
ncbi:MAG: 50S ribosomal protein L13 [Planctomycetes bacterium]|nr:50S ribosomal protein L13 [Planctomycetota bacterium]